MANIHRILADDCECLACVSWCCLWSARAIYIYEKRVNNFLSHHFSQRRANNAGDISVRFTNQAIALLSPFRHTYGNKYNHIQSKVNSIKSTLFLKIQSNIHWNQATLSSKHLKNREIILLTSSQNFFLFFDFFLFVSL